jgi:chemotaxis protein CheZ
MARRVWPWRFGARSFASEQGADARCPAAADEGVQRHLEFMAELQALRSLVASPSPDRSIMERARAQIAEAQAYQNELDLIDAAVKRTRDEFGVLGVSAAAGAKAARAGRELAATVEGTERAIETILQAAEEIDRIASLLSGEDKDLAVGIQARAARIFGACSFQDIAGQHVSNAIAALQQIQDHIARLQAVWRGIEQFEPVSFDAGSERRFLNGPRLPEDDGHSSQDDIDGLFGCA